MAHKTHDIVIKVREYTTQSGETKSQWQTVGSLMQSDRGPFIILEKWFNPAGIASDKGGIMLSCFEPRQRGESTPQQPQQNYTQPTTESANDDMPF